MIVSVKGLKELFNVSYSKIYVVLARPEFNKFYSGRKSGTAYYDLNEELTELLKKWTKRRTKKDGNYEIQDRGLMARIRTKELCKKYGYSYSTLSTILCRSEFDKYRDIQGRLIIWDKEAEQRLLKIMELKEGRTYGITGGADI